jgi:hypothetical protein
MISEYSAVQIASRTALDRTWHSPVGEDRVAGLRALTQRVTSGVMRFARTPVWPYAALWEASVLVGLVRAADPGKARSSTHAPSPTDDGFWSRF